MSWHETIKSVQLLSDKFKFSSETELNSVSQFLVSQTEGKIFHDTNEIFYSVHWFQILNLSTSNILVIIIYVSPILMLISIIIDLERFRYTD